RRDRRSRRLAKGGGARSASIRCPVQSRPGRGASRPPGRGDRGAAPVRGDRAARTLRPRSGEGPPLAGAGRRMRMPVHSKTRARLWAAPPLLVLALLSTAACNGGLGGGSNLGTAKDAPVIVVSIDTLRSDRLPAYGSKRIETPAIDALAREGIVYERAYSQIPLTLPSH